MSEPMCTADRIDLLEALSSSAMAYFEDHFDVLCTAGCRMVALLKAMDEQINICTSQLLDLDVEVPILERKVEKHEAEPPPAISPGLRRIKEALAGVMDAEPLEAAAEAIRIAKARLESEYERIAEQLETRAAPHDATDKPVLLEGEAECLKAREAMEHIRSIKDPALRAAAVRELNSGLSIIMVEEQEHAPIS